MIVAWKEFILIHYNEIVSFEEKSTLHPQFQPKI